jgi:hypothetical protein
MRDNRGCYGWRCGEFCSINLILVWTVFSMQLFRLLVFRLISPTQRDFLDQTMHFLKWSLHWHIFCFIGMNFSLRYKIYTAFIFIYINLILTLNICSDDEKFYSSHNLRKNSRKFLQEYNRSKNLRLCLLAKTYYYYFFLWIGGFTITQVHIFLKSIHTFNVTQNDTKVFLLGVFALFFNLRRCLSLSRRVNMENILKLKEDKRGLSLQHT